MKVKLNNRSAISTLPLVILLLVSGLFGAVLSYLWTVGYYVDIGTRIPEGVTTITIMNATFQREDCTYFNVTVLHPTYSAADANITSIALLTSTNDMKVPWKILPPPPYPLERGEDVTFQCNLDWGEYAGQMITVAIFVEDGSGGTSSYQTEFAKVEITEIRYNTTNTINQFNISIRNRSNIPLDLESIHLGEERIPSENISVNSQNTTFPYKILENKSQVFSCYFPLWDAENNTGYLGNSSDITITTTQGYSDIFSVDFSDPVMLFLSNVTNPQSNQTQFILGNVPLSPHHVNLGNITITVSNDTFAETFTVAETNATDFLLEKGANITILCEDERINWDAWKGKMITIKVYTSQGFIAKREEVIPSE